MIDQSRQSTAAGAEPFAELARKIVVLITEDWFALSHFQPLIAVLREFAREVVIVTRCSGRQEELAALGVRIVDFDYRRTARNPLRETQSAWTLARILEAEAPDAVHMIAMKPVVLGSLALKLVPTRHAVLHLPGLGLLSFSSKPVHRLYRAAALRVIGSALRKPSSYLLVENTDDLELLRSGGADPGPRFAILGGTGIDPDVFPVLPPPRHEVPVAAFVGRMIRAKGVDTLMEAYDRLRQRGESLTLALYGKGDEGSNEAIPADVLTAWCEKRGARWHGHVDDVREVWRQADIFVLPARGGDGMPRAMVEAAACARPLVVTDVPGCRHFVRDGVEGYVVPPDDPPALADALRRLALDADLRLRMGEAARLRLLQGFTVAHVQTTLRAAYQSLLDRPRS